MSEAKLPFSNFFSESDVDHYSPLVTAVSQTKKKREEPLPSFLSALDEAPDFHNPFSELNLFLSKEIKEHMRHCGFSKKWTGKIQEELVARISSKFQKRFPHLRLGIAALKKSWERVSHCLEQIQTQKEAITQDGKLNLSFFIRENLKQLPRAQGTFHPSLYTHQIAVKMSECIATIEGICPKFDHLTTLIWSVQRHLFSKSDLKELKTPYEEYDKIDKFIIRIILGLTAKHSQLSQLDLEYQVKEMIHSLQELPSFSSQEVMRANIAALLSDKLYASFAFQSRFLAEERKAIATFIRKHLTLCKGAVPKIPQCDLIRRVHALYLLATQLPKNLSDADIEAAVFAVHAQCTQPKPDLPQSLFAFISAELALEEMPREIPAKVETMIKAYREAVQLPSLLDKETDLLEIVTWKMLTESENLLEKLPYLIGQRIEEEIANAAIEHPDQNFSAIIQEVLNVFQTIKELAAASNSEKESKIEHKIHRWASQSDMIYRWIHLDQAQPLVKLIEEKKNKPYDELLCEVLTCYLAKHPELLPYTAHLKNRILTLYKYLWYNASTSAEESSFDRFIKWHASSLLTQSPQLEKMRLLQLLEELCKKIVPLIPFDQARCTRLISAFFSCPPSPAHSL
jgi:hypothetical protein